MSAAASELIAVGKRYIKYEDAPMLASSLARLPRRSRRERLWALRDIDFVVETGECVGVIGRNGSGKSTMLQLLGGITAPTEGRVIVRGRVAPLIAVGVGFHPELTGRDNVYLNGMILGMSRIQVQSLFDEIVAFAEIESFIDTPLKFYSSGMQVRLGFAVAVAADPEVLLVDEVLAVGDFAFQVKCLQRIEEIRARGATVMLVSHAMPMIERMCQRTIVLHAGRKVYDGDTSGAIARLHELLDPPSADVVADEDLTMTKGVAEVTSVEVIDGAGRPAFRATAGAALVARVTVRVMRDVAMPFLAMSVHGPGGVPVFHESNLRSPYPAVSAGETVVYDVTWSVHLAAGSYSVRCVLGKVDPDATTAVLAVPPPVSLYVSGRPDVRGVADLYADFRPPSRS